MGVNGLMPIGEFSRMSGLSPKRLRSYAASGLLAPAAVDPDSGYRFYSPGQVREARLIDALRDAGLPLDGIGSLVRDRSPGDLDRWAGRIRSDANRRHAALERAAALLSEMAGESRPTQKTKRREPMRLEAAGRSETGPNRQTNQDSILATGHLLLVADGMGGPPGGEVAAHLAASLVGAAFTGRSLEELEAGTRAANWAVWQRASDTSGLAGMGTTLCAVGVTEPGDVAVVNVGDCRAYLARQGSVEVLTRDHTIAADLVGRGEITPVEARSHPHRHVLTRVLGVGAQLEVDSWRIPVAPGDTVLVGSDGLFNEVVDSEIEDLLVQGRGVEETADELVDRALSRGARDNVSAVVGRIEL